MKVGDSRLRGDDEVKDGNDEMCSCHEKNYQCSLLYVVRLLNL